MADNQAKPDKNWVDYIQSLKTRVDNWLAYALLAGLLLATAFGLLAGARNVDGNLAYPLGALLALAVAGGAIALGAAFGFLFGLPRALTSGEVRELARLNADGQQSDASGNGTGVASGGFGANTNLERISDWLTTIIVGIGIANLGTLPSVLDGFGSRVDRFFNFGGHVYGIGGGLFFLIFSFLLTYISTRTKLMLIFTENERDKQSVQDGALGNLQEAVSDSLNRGLLGPPPPPVTDSAGTTGAASADGDSAGPAPAQPTANTAPAIAQATQADQLLVREVTLTNQQSPEQMLALANASARTGDFAKAKVMYQEYRKVAPPDARVALDYASVLGMNGDLSELQTLRSELAALNPTELPRLDSSFLAGARAALQTDLYNGRFENSIRLGELLVARPEMAGDAWVHVWLACAYGQRHARLKMVAADPRSLKETRDRARESIRAAIAADSSMRSYIQTLYEPGRAIGGDNDLVTFHQDDVIDRLIAEPEPEPAPPPAKEPPPARRRRPRPKTKF